MNQQLFTTTPANPKALPEIFLQEILTLAGNDPNILVLGSDPEAEAIAAFRAELPKQFVFSGNRGRDLVEAAASLARAGKTVFAYGEAGVITARCCERFKVALGATSRPVTFISVGAPVGCPDSESRSVTTDDIARLRSLPDLEVWTPCDEESTREIAIECCERPALRFVRLESPMLAEVYQGGFQAAMGPGFSEISTGTEAVILASGYMLHRALAVRDQLKMEGVDVAVTDVFRIKPLASRELAGYLSQYPQIITLEEQCLAGGFGSAIAETLVDAGVPRAMLRLGLPERYFFANGGRHHVLEKSGLGVPTIAQRITDFIATTDRSRVRVSSVPTFTSY